jgi:hypothetical protein
MFVSYLQSKAASRHRLSYSYDMLTGRDHRLKYAADTGKLK